MTKQIIYDVEGISYLMLIYSSDSKSEGKYFVSIKANDETILNEYVFQDSDTEYFKNKEQIKSFVKNFSERYFDKEILF